MSKIFILENNVFSPNVAGETVCPAHVSKIKSTPISISHHMHQRPKCENPNTEIARKKKDDTLHNVGLGKDFLNRIPNA